MFKAEDEGHHEGGDPLKDHEDRPSSPHASVNTMPLPAPAALLSFARPRTQTATSSFPSRRSADFLNFTRPVSFFTTYSKVHAGTTGVAALEQLERLDAVEASLKKLCGGVGGDYSGNADYEVDVAESPTSPSTRNGKLFKGPVFGTRMNVPVVFSHARRRRRGAVGGAPHSQGRSRRGGSLMGCQRQWKDYFVGRVRGGRMWRRCRSRYRIWMGGHRYFRGG